ncbi:S-adenosyl-L-methionine-dependent methyltransferase [Chytridium lagenaria]|nr:S-adenosyl-L-methionine-dependent methyltransferase [Chytridium lagenaria]
MANSSKDITIGPLSLSIHESTFADAGFGYQTWGSSQILAMLIITGRIPVANATILELGCGTGLSGLAAASYGAAHVFMTDFLDSLLDKARLNAKTNKIEKNVSVHKLDWREPSKSLLPSRTLRSQIFRRRPQLRHGTWQPRRVNVLLLPIKNVTGRRIYLVLPVRPKFENEKEEFDIQMEAHGLVKEAFETYLQEDIQDMGLNGMDRAFSTGEKGFRFYVFKWAGK